MVRGGGIGNQGGRVSSLRRETAGVSQQSLHEVGSDRRLRERLAALERLPQASRDALVLLLDALLATHGFLTTRSANRPAPSQEEVWWCLERVLAAQLGRSQVPPRP